MMNKSYQKRLDEVVVQLKCYEPAGECIELTERELMGHTLVTGGSGAGKSTRVINPIVEQLLQRYSKNSKSRHGILIYDTKADGETENFLRKACFQANRESDLIILSPDQTAGCVELMGELNSQTIESADTLAGLLSASVSRASDNRYWEDTFQSLLRHSIRLYAMSSKKPKYTDSIEFLLNYLLLAQLRDPDTLERLECIEQLEKESDKELKLVIGQIQSTHKMWELLDYRTKSILRSMATPLLDALNNPAAKGVFSYGPPCQIGSALESGKVILVSIDAMRNPDLARLLGCIIKGKYYDTVLRRILGCKVSPRPLGLILDDWLMAATGGVGDHYSDVSALSLIRSRGGYLLAGCQSLAALDLVMGADSRRAAFANFANLFCFRGRDAEMDAYAAAYFGQKSETLVDLSIPQLKHPSPRHQPVRYEREVRLPAVPVGALARLPLGEAYALIGNRVYDRPLCLVPSFTL